MANIAGIPAKYMDYIVAAIIVVAVLYAVSHYMETTAGTLGLTYQGE